MRTRRGRPRLVTFLTLALALLAAACGGGGGSGGAGVANGGILGSVFGIVGGVAGQVPLEGVTVTATEVGGRGRVRTSFTDSFGDYLLADVPLGRWELTFFAPGFTAGALDRVEVFVESGAAVVAPDFLLIETSAPGAGNVLLFLVDDATGDPVLGATVTVGGFAADAVFLDGSYEFNVPVSQDPLSGLPLPMAITVAHASYLGGFVTPSTVTPIAGVPVVQTVRVTPAGSRVAGRLEPATLASLYFSQGAVGGVSITSPQIPTAFLVPDIDPLSGNFTVQVPASGAGPGIFDLQFTSPFFQGTAVTNILAPGPGTTATLSSPVVLQPLTTTLAGAVVSVNGGAISGAPNQVVVVETGRLATPINGSYTMVSTPIGIPLTLRATVIGAFGVELGQAVTTPVGGGVFTAPTIVTAP